MAAERVGTYRSVPGGIMGCLPRAMVSSPLTIITMWGASTPHGPHAPDQAPCQAQRTRIDRGDSPRADEKEFAGVTVERGVDPVVVEMEHQHWIIAEQQQLRDQTDEMDAVIRHQPQTRSFTIGPAVGEQLARI